MSAFAAVLSVAVAFAEESPVRVEVADVEGAPGATVRVPVHFQVPAGAHIYADMIQVDVTGAGPLTVGPIEEPPGKLVADPANPAKQRETYEAGDTVVQLPVTLPADAHGSYPLELVVTHQACRVGLCFPPKEDQLSLQVRVAGVLSVPGIGTAGAQTPPAEEPAASFAAAEVGPGLVGVKVDLQNEWHINKMFVSLSVSEPAGTFTVGELVLPPAVPSGKVEDGTYREDFERDFTIVAPVTGPEGKATVKVDVGYQACKGVSLCRMPTVETVTVPIDVLPAGQAPTLPDPATLMVAAEAAHAAPAEAPAPAEGAAAPADAASDPFGAAMERGLFWVFLLCFMAGVGVSFTPCVLPMVPIIMGIIGARGASRVESVSLSISYIVGQVAVYTALGVFAGLSGGLFGGQMQNPWLVGGIGLVFVALSLSMFGFYDIQVPGFIQSKLSGYDKRGGHGVAFVFGMIGGVLAGPCSGPVVLAMLGVIASQGQAVLGAALMATFALGMGMIFLVAGVAISALPKRGAWMNLIKKGFGPLLLLLAIFFTKTLFTDVQVALLTSAVLLVTGVFAWPDPEDGEGFYPQRLRQLYTVLSVIVGGWLLVAVLMTEGFILPAMRLGAPGGVAAAEAGARIHWLSTEADGLAAAEAAGGKPLMIDFTAEWCAACHELEKYTYTDAAVIRESEGFVTVMIDCTDEADPVVKAVQAKYGVKGLPTVVFARPDGTILESTVGFVEAPEFQKVMARARAKAAG